MVTYNLNSRPREKLGKTNISIKNSKVSQNSVGGYDLDIVIDIELNRKLKGTSRLLHRNPGLDIEVLAHERGHAAQLTDVLRAIKIVDLINNSQLSDTRLNNYFQGLLDLVILQFQNYGEEDANRRSSQFLPPGYNMIYNNGKIPIKW